MDERPLCGVEPLITIAMPGRLAEPVGRPGMALGVRGLGPRTKVERPLYAPAIMPPSTSAFLHPADR